MWGRVDNVILDEIGLRSWRTSWRTSTTTGREQCVCPPPASTLTSLHTRRGQPCTWKPTTGSRPAFTSSVGWNFSLSQFTCIRTRLYIHYNHLEIV